MAKTTISAPSGAGTTTPPVSVVGQWLSGTQSQVGRHSLNILSEVAGARALLLGAICHLVKAHYVAPATAAKRLAALGAPKTALLLREHLPKTKTARSGDLGEILATELAEVSLKFRVPIRRLRWKDGREMALRGDDIIGVKVGAQSKVEFLKGESKSRVALSKAVVDEAAEALDTDRGRPTRHSVLFVAERLRELGDDPLALALEDAVLCGFTGCRVEHLLLTVTGGNPTNLLTAHLTACATKRRVRHGLGVHIPDHGSFIDALYSGL